MLPWSAELAGRLDEHLFTSELLRDNPLNDPHERPLWAYVPPGYDDEPDRRYPSIYVIQGYTGHLEMWRNRMPYRQPFTETADAMLARPETPRAIVVYVDAWTAYGGSQFVDSPEHQAAKALNARLLLRLGRRGGDAPGQPGATGSGTPGARAASATAYARRSPGCPACGHRAERAPDRVPRRMRRPSLQRGAAAPRASLRSRRMDPRGCRDGQGRSRTLGASDGRSAADRRGDPDHDAGR